MVTERADVKAKVFDYMDSRLHYRDIEDELVSMTRLPWTFDVSYNELEMYIKMYFERGRAPG